MAYMNFSEVQAAAAGAVLPIEREAQVSLSALEWSVVAIAQKDRITSLSSPSRLSVALGAVFGGKRPNPRLADDRLEALRRIAVLAWHYGYTIPTDELRAFLAAGYSLDQYELVQDSIGRARATRKPRNLQ